MKLSEHVLGLGLLIPITLALIVALKGIVTGGATFSPSVFMYDPQDDRPANARNR
jgi:hypothetical protein